jgi:aldehyde dehydrogenase (NAD+)
MPRYQHHIDGEWREPASGEWFETFDPYRGRAWALIGRGGAEDAALAAEAAHRAAGNGPWSRASPRERSAALRRIASVLRARWGELVASEARDNGKRVVEVRAQCAALHTWYDYFAGQAEELGDQIVANMVPGIANRLRHEPYGAVLAITPWNSPLMIAAWKIAPALAAGNAVVIKPSEHASVSTLDFVRLIDDAGLPGGVINVIAGIGREVGEALVSHPHIAKVTFTGSEESGRAVAETAARGLKPVVLELGGKSPQVVFADANIEEAVKGVLAGIFLSNGQTCVAGSRLIVDQSVHDQVVERLVKRVSRLRFGDPMDPLTDVGPIANAPQHRKDPGVNPGRP